MQNLTKDQLQQLFATSELLDFARQYFNLDQAGQLKVYGSLNPQQQKAIWGAYETLKQQKENPFHGLTKAELKVKYLGLPQEEQTQAYAKLSEAQKKLIWEIYEEEKRKKENPSAAEKDGEDFELSGEKIDSAGSNLMKIPKNLRKNILDGMSNEDLIAAYKKIDKEADRHTIWGELTPQQQQIIQTAAAVQRNEEALKKAQGSSLRWSNRRSKRSRERRGRSTSRR